MSARPVVAVVGSGFMAQAHIAAYSSLPDADVKYVVGRRLATAQPLAVTVGAQAVADFEIALKDPDVNVVDITVPTPLHRDFVLAALESGKHVIVEKPISRFSHEAEEMIAAAEASGQHLFVAHVLRFWPIYERISQIARSGQMGKALYARTYRFASPPRWAEWLSDTRQTGGAAVDLGIHDIDFCNSVFGAPLSVQAWGSRRVDSIPLQYAASIEYEDLVVLAEASMVMPEGYPFSSGIQIQFEDGLIEHQFRAGGASFEEGQAVDSTMVIAQGGSPEAIQVSSEDPFEKQLGHFMRVVSGKEEKLVVTARQARLALSVSETINRSVLEGRRIEIS